jgi:hypothetical protein
MVYTREQLLKAVRDAGRDGQPFTLGTVREQLGLKTRDKRELKRFRSRFRECCSAFGASGIEKLGPNTFRLSAAVAAPPARPVPVAKPVAEVAARSSLPERVGASTRPARSQLQAEPAPSVAPSVARTAAVERPADRFSDAVSTPTPAQAAIPSRGLGSRVLSFLGIRGAERKNTAGTALSRLALDLQPSSAKFQYQCVDGELRVSVTDTDTRRRATTHG